MSTRCNIVLTETHVFGEQSRTSKLFFYCHSDGYPEGAMPLLNIFMRWMNEGKIRNDVGQGGGWLIMLGAIEYGTIPSFQKEKPAFDGGHSYGKLETIESPEDWKVGAIEPTEGIHGDIEYLYVIDMRTKTLKCYDSWDDEGNGVHEVRLSKKILAA